MFTRLTRIITATIAAAVIAFAGAGSAFASHGADDPAGHHHAHHGTDDPAGHHHRHHHHHHGGGNNDGPNHT